MNFLVTNIKSFTYPHALKSHHNTLPHKTFVRLGVPIFINSVF